MHVATLRAHDACMRLFLGSCAFVEVAEACGPKTHHTNTCMQGTGTGCSDEENEMGEERVHGWCLGGV